MTQQTEIARAPNIAQLIYAVRDQWVILDSNLAAI